MIPSIISTDTLSLNDKTKRNALTVIIDFNENLDIENYDIEESIFHNTKRYDYESFSNDFTNPDSKNHKTLQDMYEFALKRKEKRIMNGAIEFNESDRRIQIGTSMYRSKNIAERIIEEFMVTFSI